MVEFETRDGQPDVRRDPDGDARADVRASLVGVIGAGTMGAGIAQVALLAGHRVALYDKIDGAAANAVTGLAARLDSQAAKGKLSAADRDAAKDRLSVADELASFEGAFLVIEAIVENLAVKRELFAALEDVVGPDGLLATNTSSLSVTAIGAGLRHPERLVGMHFFNPAPLLPLVEVITGLATSPEAADAVARYAESWGKTTVRCASTPGFIVNRVARPYYGEALRAAEEGAADFATIDAVLRDSGGFKMGPFELMDLIGLDVNLAVSTSVWEATDYDPRYAPAWTQKEYVAAGRTGRKSGRGFYDYAEAAEKQAPAMESRDETEPLTEAGRSHWEAFLASGELPLLNVYPSKGKTATSYGDGRILVDLALDYRTAKVIALAPAADADPDSVRQAVEFIQAAGKDVILMEDVPGMIVTRTVARLVNEAVDSVFRGDAEEEDVDLAMKLGVNYPRGPIAWGGDLGMHWVLGVLDNLEDTYRDGRYRASPLLRQLAHADKVADAMFERRAWLKAVGEEMERIEEEARRIAASRPSTATESVEDAIQRLKQDPDFILEMARRIRRERETADHTGEAFAGFARPDDQPASRTAATASPSTSSPSTPGADHADHPQGDDPS